MKKLHPKTESLVKRMKELDIITHFYPENCTHLFEKAQSNFPDMHDLIWEIIMASDRCFKEDAHTGRYPPDYESLMGNIMTKLFPSISNYSVQFDYKDGIEELQNLKLSLSLSNEKYVKTLKDYRDYVDCKSVLDLLNQSIKFNEGFALYDIESNDTGFYFMLLNLAQINTLFQLYDFVWEDDFINKLIALEWTASVVVELDENFNKRDYTPKQLLGILRDSTMLSQDKLIELCRKYEHQMVDGMSKFYEQVLISRFNDAAMIARIILMEKHGYGGQEIYDLLMNAFFDVKKINSISNIVNQIHDWPTSIMPSLSRILGVFDNMEKTNYELYVPPFEWLILLLGCKDEKLFDQLDSALHTYHNNTVKKISIEAMGMSTFVLEDHFSKIKIDRITKLYIGLVNSKNNNIRVSHMMPYLRFHSTRITTQKLIDIFDELRPNIDVISMIGFIKIINRSVFLNGYDQIIEKRYLTLWEEDFIFTKYLISGLLQSKNPEIQQKLKDASDTSDASIKEAFKYDLKKAEAEDKEIIKGIQIIKNIIKAKHED